MNLLKYLIVLGAIYVTVNFALEKSSETISVDRAGIIQRQKDYLVSQTQQSNGDRKRLPGPTRLPAVPEYINETLVKYQTMAQTITSEVKYPPNYLLIWEADWCSKCARMKAIGDKLKNEGFDVFYIDFDTNKKQARKDKITGIPVAIVYTIGKEVKRFVGISQRTEARTEAQIRKVLRKNKCH